MSRSETYSLGLGGLLPTGLSYSFSANTTNARDSLSLPFDNYASFAGVSAKQPLLRDGGFGPATAQVRIAMTNRSISEWEFRQAVIDNITRVIFAYYDLAFAQARLRSALSSRDLAAQLASGGQAVALMMGGVEVPGTTTDARQKRLLHVVEEIGKERYLAEQIHE